MRIATTLAIVLGTVVISGCAATNAVVLEDSSQWESTIAPGLTATTGAIPADAPAGAPFTTELEAAVPPGNCATEVPSGAGDHHENDRDDHEDAGDDWRHFVTLYGWLPSFRGDVTVKGQDSEPSLSRRDIWNNLDIAFMGRYEVAPPDSEWSFWFDAFYSNLQDDASAVTQVGNIDADFDVHMTFVELAAAWHAWRSDERMASLHHDTPRTQIDLFGGARYGRMRMEVDVDAPGIGASLSADESEHWVDSMVGARMRHGLAPGWVLTLRGDVGGFGIGTSSDLAWTATGTIQYMLTEQIAVGGGWKIMDLDYKRSDFEADVQMSGPFVTMTYEF